MAASQNLVVLVAAGAQKPGYPAQNFALATVRNNSFIYLISNNVWLRLPGRHFPHSEACNDENIGNTIPFI